MILLLEYHDALNTLIEQSLTALIEYVKQYCNTVIHLLPHIVFKVVLLKSPAVFYKKKY